MMHLTDFPIAHEKAFYTTITPLLFVVIKELLQDFLLKIRSKVKNRHNVGIIIDGGWSHPGWWAREHTVGRSIGDFESSGTLYKG